MKLAEPFNTSYEVARKRHGHHLSKKNSMKDDVIFAEIGFDCKKELTVVGWAGHEVAAGGAGSDDDY